VAPPAFSTVWVIRTTLSVWRRDAPALTVVSLLFSAPLVPLVLATGDTSRVYVGAGGLLGLLASGALCAGVVADLRGSRPRVGEMIAVALRRSGSLVLASLISGLAILLGLVLLVAPGAIAWAGLFVVVPVLAAEPERGPVQALRRSWELTRGRRLGVFAVALASLAGALVAAMLVGVARLQVFGDSRAGSAIAELLLAPILGVNFSVPGIAYHALCVEKEGAGLARPAAVPEPGPAA
jgi:hypothetical protein